VANIETDIKRLFVRTIQWDADDASVTFFTTLKAFARARMSQTKSGLVLVGTEGNGHISTFRIPKEFSTSDAAALSEEIIRRYEEAIAALAVDGLSVAQNSAIAAEILDNMNAVRDDVSVDFSGLRTSEEIPS